MNDDKDSVIEELNLLHRGAESSAEISFRWPITSGGG